MFYDENHHKGLPGLKWNFQIPFSTPKKQQIQVYGNMCMFLLTDFLTCINMSCKLCSPNIYQHFMEFPWNCMYLCMLSRIHGNSMNGISFRLFILMTLQLEKYLSIHGNSINSHTCVVCYHNPVHDGNVSKVKLSSIHGNSMNTICFRHIKKAI